MMNLTASKAWVNYRWKIRHNTKFGLVILILHLVSIPLALGFTLTYFLSEINQSADTSAAYNPSFSVLIIIPVAATLIAGALGVVLAFQMFPHLYKKTQVDMDLSFPLTTRQRFFSNYLAGLTLYVLPFLLVSLISFLILGIGGAVLNGAASSADPMIKEQALEIWHIVERAVPTLIFCGLLMMLMLYTMTVLICTCCGTFFESVAYTIVTHVLLFFLPTSIIRGLFSHFYGMSPPEQIIQTRYFISPLGGLYGLINILDRRWLSDTYFTDFLLSIGLPMLLMTALYFALAYILYLRRKAEDVSKPFVYKGFYYFILTCGMICLTCLFLSSLYQRYPSFQDWGYILLITALAYFLFEVVTNRGFRRFWVSAVRYGATIAGVAGISILINYTGCFGAETRVPTESQVSSVSFEYTGLRTRQNFRVNMEISDNKQIQDVVSWHQKVLDLRFLKPETTAEINSQTAATNPYYNSGPWTTLTYHLKSGGSFTREYYSSTFDQFFTLRDFSLSEQYIDQFTAQMQENFEKLAFAVKFDNEGKRDSTNANVMLLRPFTRDPYPNSQFLKFESSQQEIDEFFAALNEDLSSVSMEELLNPTSEYLGEIQFSYTSDTIPMYSNYTHLIDYMRRYGLRLPDLSWMENAEDFSSNHTLAFISPEQAETQLSYYLRAYNDGIYRVIDSYGPRYPGNLQNESIQAQDIQEISVLLRAAQPFVYLTEEEAAGRWVMVCNGDYYSLPKEAAPLAEQLSQRYPFKVLDGPLSVE